MVVIPRDVIIAIKQICASDDSPSWTIAKIDGHLKLEIIWALPHDGSKGVCSDSARPFSHKKHTRKNPCHKRRDGNRLRVFNRKKAAEKRRNNTKDIATAATVTNPSPITDPSDGDTVVPASKEISNDLPSVNSIQTEGRHSAAPETHSCNRPNICKYTCI